MQTGILESVQSLVPSRAVLRLMVAGIPDKKIVQKSADLTPKVSVCELRGTDF